MLLPPIQGKKLLIIVTYLFALKKAFAKPSGVIARIAPLDIFCIDFKSFILSIVCGGVGGLEYNCFGNLK